MATRKLTTALGLALVCQAALAVTEVRWTGGGSDTRMTTQGNWATPVTLTDGSLLAAFGNGGSAAGVVGQLYLNGVRFDSGSAFTVSAADASADLAIGDGGIAAAKAADYRISAPVRILADQTWELESVSGCKLTISGPLNAGQSPYTITIAGGGRIDVSGGGDFAGSVNIQGGSVVLYGRDAFGSGEGTISVQERAVSLSGTTVAKDFFFDCGTTWSSKARIGVWAGNSAIRGKVSFSDQNFTICPYMNSCVMFEGGVEGPGWPCLREGSGGRIVFTETPVSFRHGLGAIGDGTPDAAGFAYYIDFSVADNVLPSLGTEGGAAEECLRPDHCRPDVWGYGDGALPRERRCAGSVRNGAELWQPDRNRWHGTSPSHHQHFDKSGQVASQPGESLDAIRHLCWQSLRGLR